MQFFITIPKNDLLSVMNLSFYKNAGHVSPKRYGQLAYNCGTE